MDSVDIFSLVLHGALHYNVLTRFFFVTGVSDTIMPKDLKEILKVMFYQHDALSTDTLTPIHLKRITGEP